MLDVIAFRGSSCDNTDWIDAQVAAYTTYTIPNIPPGTYYVRSSNKGDTWYVNEYHTVSGSTNNGVSYTCDGATQVVVNSGMDTPNIDFQLDSGGRISGIVYKSDGSTPIPDADIRVNPFVGGACEGECGVNGTVTSNGSYTIAGLPAGIYYIQAFLESGANYINEWYDESLSSHDCNDADPVQVWVGVETQNIDFQLDSGGSITGKLVDENGQPLGNLEVEYDSESPGNWQNTWSNQADGTFTLSGLGAGSLQIKIISDPGRYLAGFRRHFYLEPGEQKDIGTLKVRKGVVISGMVTKDSVPLPDLELSVGAKLILAEVDTGGDGTFNFVLPPGEFTINTADSMDPITTLPQEVVVTESDIMTNKSVPTIAAYDTSNGDVYSGTVTINASPPPSAELMVFSFMNDQELGLNNWGAVSPLSIGGPFDGSSPSNPYQLATPLGSIVQLTLGLYNTFSDGNESLTVIDSASDLSNGGAHNFTYNNSDSTVDGYVLRNGEVVFWASVGLYREPGNEFAGFARTDHTGYFLLYDVPDGTYRVDATAEDYDCIKQTPNIVVSGNLTLSAIELGECASYHSDEFAADFGANGLWHYDGSDWSQLTTLNPEAMETWEGDLAVGFSTSGLWSYDGATWDFLTINNPEEMVGWSQGLAADFGGLGLWNYDGSNWSPLTTSNPKAMESWPGSLAVDFGVSGGLWAYDGSTWTFLTTHDAENMVAWNHGLAGDFGTSGLWNYDGSNWTLLTTNDAVMMQSWNRGLAVDFSTGLWSYDGASWAFLTTSHPEGMGAWNNGLAADFGGSGLWSYDGSSWGLLTSQNPETMEGWASGLAVDLGGAGLWTYDGSDWSQLTTSDADDMIAVDLKP